MNAATRWLPPGLGALAFLVYALLAPPSFHWLDAAELSAAGAAMGSPHPTGFPLYMLLVKAASLVPIGEIAFRINLLSALCGGLSVGFVSALVIRVGSGGPAAIAGGLVAAFALGSSVLFARHAVVAEVYVVTTAAATAVLLLLWQAGRHGPARVGLLLAATCGLGLGLHANFRWFIALPAFIYGLVCLRRGAKWPLFAPILAVAIGVTLQLYLPVRSAAIGTEAVDWGHPQTLEGLVDHLSAKRIRSSYAAEIASTNPLIVGHNAKRTMVDLFDGVGPAALLLGLFGMVVALARRKTRPLGSLLVGIAALDVLYWLWINPMGIETGQNGTLACASLAIGAGIGSIALVRKSGRAAPFIGFFIAVLVSVGPALLTSDEIATASRDEVPRRVAEKALHQIPPRAIALTQSDSLSAAALFLTVVEGARPDISALVRQHIGDKRRTRAITGIDTSELAVLLRSERPIAWEIGDDPIPGMSAAGFPFTILGQAPRSGALTTAIHDIRDSWKGAELDPVSAKHLAAALTGLGRLAFRRGEIDRARDLFDAAILARSTHISALVNRGVVASHLADYASALQFTERALSLAPNRVSALVNAARYHNAIGNASRAVEYLTRATRLEPQNRKIRAELTRIKAR